MSLIRWNSVLDAIGESLTTSPDAKVLLAALPGEGSWAWSPEEARKLLRDPDGDPAERAALWRAVLTYARQEEGEGPWRLMLVWLLWPRLRSTVYKVSRQFRTDVKDVEGDLMLSLLDGLGGVDPDHPGTDSQLVAAAVNCAWRRAKAAENELATDFSLAAEPESALWEPREAFSELVPDSEITVVPRPDASGLKAPIRFTRPGAQADNAWIALLADEYEQREAVEQRTRRRAGSRRVLTVSLRGPRRRR